jgi:hypothetical protein
MAGMNAGYNAKTSTGPSRNISSIRAIEDGTGGGGVPTEGNTYPSYCTEGSVNCFGMGGDTGVPGTGEMMNYQINSPSGPSTVGPGASDSYSFPEWYMRVK